MKKMMNEQFFFVFNKEKFRKHFFGVKTKRIFCSEERVVLRKNQREKDKKKTKTKKRRTTEGVSQKEIKKENEKGASGETQRS